MTVIAWFSHLRVRLLILIGLAVLPGLVVGFSTASRWRRHETEDARADALRLARHAAALHARMIDNSRGALFSLAQLSASYQGREDELRLLLQACLVEQRSYESIEVVRPDGRVAIRVGSARETVRASERASFNRALATRSFAVGDYEIDPRAAKAALTFAYPMTAAGEVTGILAATVSLDWLQDLATKALVPPGTAIAMFDDSGTVFAREPGARDGTRGSEWPHSVLHSLAAGNAERTGELITADGISRQYAFAPLLGSPGGRLYVLIGIPTVVATAGADQILYRNIATVVLALVLAIAVAWIGSDFFILRQTRALLAATARVSAGDLEARTGVADGSGELSQLARAFDAMAATLQHRAQKIESQHQALHQQARRFRAMIEGSSDGILLTDAQGSLRYVSPSTARILGYDPPHLMKTDAFALVHPEDRDFARAQFANVLEQPGGFATGTLRLRHRDGRWRWIEATLTNLLHEPAVQAIVSNYRDVTESREAAESLVLAQRQLETRVKERTAELSRANAALESEVAERRRAQSVLCRFSRVIEQTDDSVFITNREGVIEYVNSAFERLTGYSSQEAVGVTPRLFSSGHHDAAFYQSMWETLLAGRTFRSVFLNKARDGRLYYEDQTVTPLQDETGSVTHYVSTGRDITRRMRTEEALRRLNERLEHEATRIAAALHDEAAQFLTAAHIALAEIAQDMPPPTRERINGVRRHLDQAEGQLRRLAHELRPRILDDLGLVEALRFLADGVSRRSGVQVSVVAHLDRRCSPQVETAVYRMVQEALTNLSKHACASRGDVVLRAEGDTLHCSVSDNGRGFDVAAGLSRRGDSSLGLIGIQDRLEAVGGLFEVVSTPGEGTELRARIPLEH